MHGNLKPRPRSLVLRDTHDTNREWGYDRLVTRSEAQIKADLARQLEGMEMRFRQMLADNAVNDRKVIKQEM